ncbi:MAG: hypothetical protein WA919_03545 [Coleofasciculaceae cyanobacterium]
MKTITKERILKALDNNSKYLNNKPECHIVSLLAQIGLKSVISEAFGAHRNPVTERDHLELAYQGFTEPEKIFKRLSHWDASQGINSVEGIKEAWMHSFKRTLERKWKRDKKITEIQRQHGISGLSETKIDFGNAIVKYHEPHEELALLDSDFEVLYSERTQIAEAFIAAFKYHEMSLYRRVRVLDSDDWIETNPSFVLETASSSRWVKVSEQKNYINYHELETKGHTTIKDKPETPHDSLEWEFHLVTGTGRPDVEEGSMWFCARMGNKKPAL